jgi:hypothetical protein
VPGSCGATKTQSPLGRGATGLRVQETYCQATYCQLNVPIRWIVSQSRDEGLGRSAQETLSASPPAMVDGAAVRLKTGAGVPVGSESLAVGVAVGAGGVGVAVGAGSTAPTDAAALTRCSTGPSMRTDVAMISALTCWLNIRSGRTARTSAACPETRAVAIDVPLQ